jgi:hypothetical protein
VTDPDRRLQLDRDRVEFTDVEGEIVVLDLERSLYLAVNGTGAVLWRLLYEGASLEELRGRLTSAYPIDEATATADVGAFVSELDRAGLLLRAAPDRP